jgi:hypothetical protein
MAQEFMKRKFIQSSKDMWWRYKWKRARQECYWCETPTGHRIDGDPFCSVECLYQVDQEEKYDRENYR